MAYANILGFFGHEWITKAHADRILDKVDPEPYRYIVDGETNSYYICDLFDKSPERDVEIYLNNYSGNWIRRVLGLLELAETQDFDFIPELEEN